MKINKLTARLSLSLIIIIFLSAIISALAVSMPYMENKQLKMLPGESRDFKFVLQSGEGRDINVRTDITKGSEIINFVDSENIYLVKEGDKVTVNTKITIPEESAIGESYNIELTFETSPVQESGQFAFGSSIKQTFEVVVVKALAEEPKEQKLLETNQLAIYLIIVIAIILIIIYLVKKKKKSR